MSQLLEREGTVLHLILEHVPFIGSWLAAVRRHCWRNDECHAAVRALAWMAALRDEALKQMTMRASELVRRFLHSKRVHGGIIVSINS